MAVTHAKGRKSRMAAKEAKPTRHNRPTSPMLELGMAISHPVRFRIITAMNAPERNASPKELAEEFDLDVKRVAYHVRELTALGYLELVDTEPRRGSIEHVYRPVQGFEAWSQEWSELFPAFKRIVAASALGWASKRSAPRSTRAGSKPAKTRCSRRTPSGPTSAARKKRRRS